MLEEACLNAKFMGIIVCMYLLRVFTSCWMIRALNVIFVTRMYLQGLVFVQIIVKNVYTSVLRVQVICVGICTSFFFLLLVRAFG